MDWGIVRACQYTRELLHAWKGDATGFELAAGPATSSLNTQSRACYLIAASYRVLPARVLCIELIYDRSFFGSSCSRSWVPFSISWTMVACEDLFLAEAYSNALFG